MSTLQLSDEQKRKLRMLECEIDEKRKRDEATKLTRSATAERTGIPIELVDLDVIKIGAVLGLIKNKSIRDGTESESANSMSLVGVLLGRDNIFGSACPKTYDLTKIPNGFFEIPESVSEEDRISFQTELVMKRCEFFSKFVEKLIDSKLKAISECVSITMNSRSIDSLIYACKENVSMVMEFLEESDDDELWTQLEILRKAMIGSMAICEYKTFVFDRVKTLREMGKSDTKIFNNLSPIEARLILFPGWSNKPLNLEDAERFRADSIVRTYSKSPELAVFDMNVIVRECCVPTVAFLPLSEIVSAGIIGPFNNDPICCLRNVGGDDGLFYELTEIVGGGIRLWTLDSYLREFIESLAEILIGYCVKIFRTFYAAKFGDNFFRDEKSLGDEFSVSFANIAFVSNEAKFGDFVREAIRTRAVFVPTELDRVNSMKSDKKALAVVPSRKRDLKLFDNASSLSFRNRWGF